MSFLIRIRNRELGINFKLIVYDTATQLLRTMHYFNRMLVVERISGGRDYHRWRDHVWWIHSGVGSRRFFLLITLRDILKQTLKRGLCAYLYSILIVLIGFYYALNCVSPFFHLLTDYIRNIVSIVVEFVTQDNLDQNRCFKVV